uniref:DNA gyrase C-terminal beta-propeller domain-containing protein n=1 Tax=Azonexus sp. TaxID=1872668 RepID=UPI0039E67562
LDDRGRAYSISAADLPGGKGDGVPATSLAEFQEGGKLLLAQAVSGQKTYLVAGAGGYGFLVKGEDLLSRGKAGKAFLSLEAGEKPAVFQSAPNSEEIAVFTQDGRALVFPLAELRLLAKGRGLKLIAAEAAKAALTHIEAVIDGSAGKLKGERLALCRGARGGKGKALKAAKK